MDNLFIQRALKVNLIAMGGFEENDLEQYCHCAAFETRWLFSIDNRLFISWYGIAQ